MHPREAVLSILPPAIILTELACVGPFRGPVDFSLGRQVFDILKV